MASRLKGTSVKGKRYRIADFTRENYRHLLKLAKQTYTFREYTNFKRDERFILWRHDVDLSVHAARKLAQIETEEGIVATYFLHLHSKFYNLLESVVSGCVREILSLGHEIGLHFDCHYYGINCEEQLDRFLRAEARILQENFGQKIRVFSFHNPTPFTMNCKQWQYAGLINTYAEYLQTKVGYCSDANGYWRVRRLEDVLREARDERLQVSLHPEWWQDTPMPPRQRVYRAIDGRAEYVKRSYEQSLREAGRENVDWE